MTAPTRRSPDIVIWQHGADTKIRIGRAKSIPIPLPPSQDIRPLVKTFLRKIECARPKDVEPSVETARDFIRTARQAAYRLFAEITIGSFDDIATVVGDIRSHIRNWTRAGDPPFAEIIVNDSEYLPWEWLAEPISRQARDIDEPEQREGQQDASKLLGDAVDVLGFAAIMRRVLLKTMAPKDEAIVSHHYLISKSNTLQVRYIRHSDLGGASLQEGYFNSHADAISLVGPVPDATQGLPISLASQLLDPTVDSLKAGRRLTGLDQVVHLHCHHEATPREIDDPAPMESKLVFSDSSPPFEVTYSQLLDGLIEQKTRLDLKKKGIDRPLVFLNACRGDFHPLSAQSFSRLLIQNGNRGVVSTSIKVPDDAAARFAKFFYDKLFWKSGTTVGMALQQAKMELLKNHNNPLGILYTYSGDPDLMIMPPLAPVYQVAMPI